MEDQATAVIRQHDQYLDSNGHHKLLSYKGWYTTSIVLGPVQSTSSTLRFGPIGTSI
jgi:hypothetical protein